MITPQKLLLSIAATAAGFALILSSVMISAADTTGATGADVDQVAEVKQQSSPAYFLYQAR
jgi:hypothetical protein